MHAPFARRLARESVANGLLDTVGGEQKGAPRRGEVVDAARKRQVGGLDSGGGGGSEFDGREIRSQSPFPPLLQCPGNRCTSSEWEERLGAWLSGDLVVHSPRALVNKTLGFLLCPFRAGNLS